MFENDFFAMHRTLLHCFISTLAINLFIRVQHLFKAHKGEFVEVVRVRFASSACPHSAFESSSLTKCFFFLQIRNRFDKDYDENMTAGYHAVLASVKKL